MIAMVLATASAFTPHMKPLHVTRPAIHANDRVVMMPKFLKDLFPDMDKPDDIFGKIKEAFGMKEEEETPPPAVEEPEVEAAGDETPPAEEDA